eukprot:CAMPEP_0174714660 /NCGR_PEP_ID=MMETSP1094-20130205/18649_1 /TAXON_ID=156173 /ORGANISM="Chrysochromulina brevifilum, Strain UTEX LB 985" /LENGTH=54 /DNA_ID=CAMNT_0015914061 /DNA_START=115 /DNA_END=276 /DNA_ORIENTATION=+
MMSISLICAALGATLDDGTKGFALTERFEFMLDVTKAFALADSGKLIAKLVMPS